MKPSERNPLLAPEGRKNLEEREQAPQASSGDPAEGHPLHSPGRRMAGVQASRKQRVAAVVGLSLLEVIRIRDLPSEILDSENPSETMPRRLGLSDAVEQQIRRFKAEARRRGGISDDEVRALFGLVLRRPDAQEVFFQTGEALGGKELTDRSRRRWYPERIGYAIGRRRVERRFRSLFGRGVGGFAHGPFVIEASGHVLLEMDPKGHACSLLSGLAQTILSRHLSRPVRVAHPACLGERQEVCRWIVSDGEPPHRG